MGNATFTDTSFQEALKIAWPEKRLMKMMLEQNPTAALLPIKDFPGRSLYLPVQVGIQAGRSAVFATAQTNRVGSQQKAFILTTIKDYAVGGIDGETLEAIESEESLIDGVKDEMEGASRSSSAPSPSTSTATAPGRSGRSAPTTARRSSPSATAMTR